MSQEQRALCSSCQAQPALISVETNGLKARSALCAGCFARRVAEQKRHRVTPVAVPVLPLPTR